MRAFFSVCLSFSILPCCHLLTSKCILPLKSSRHCVTKLLSHQPFSTFILPSAAFLLPPVSMKHTVETEGRGKSSSPETPKVRRSTRQTKGKSMRLAEAPQDDHGEPEHTSEEPIEEETPQKGKRKTPTQSESTRKRTKVKKSNDEVKEESKSGDSGVAKAKRTRVKKSNVEMKEASNTGESGEAAQPAEHGEDRVSKIHMVTNEENRALVEMINEMSGRYLKAGDDGRGIHYAQVSKAIRECEEKIVSGEQAKVLPGVGEHIADHIDEFLRTGKVEKLEELRENTNQQ